MHIKFQLLRLLGSQVWWVKNSHKGKTFHSYLFSIFRVWNSIFFLYLSTINLSFKFHLDTSNESQVWWGFLPLLLAIPSPKVMQPLLVLHQQQPEQNLMEIVRVVCRVAVVKVLLVFVVEWTMLRGLMKRRHLLRRAWTSSDMSVAIAICQICSDKSPLNAIQINKLPAHVRVSVSASGVCVCGWQRAAKSSSGRKIAKVKSHDDDVDAMF